MLLFTRRLTISTVMPISLHAYTIKTFKSGLFWCRVIKLIIYAHSIPNYSIEEPLLAPKQNLLSFAQQQHTSRHISQSRHRFKRIANITHQNETETECIMVRLSKEDDHLERVVRADPKKSQNFRFTFTESHIPTE